MPDHEYDPWQQLTNFQYAGDQQLQGSRSDISGNIQLRGQRIIWCDCGEEERQANDTSFEEVHVA